MRKQLAVLAGAFAMLALTGNPALAQVRACSLLSAGEIGTTLGGQPTPSEENSVTIPDGLAKGETVRSCMWRTGGGDTVTLNVMRALQGAQREAGSATLNRAMTRLKQQGWTENARTIGNARCSTWTPPAARKSAPITACMGEAKGMALFVGAMSMTRELAVEPIKALFDGATARLP